MAFGRQQTKKVTKKAPAKKAASAKGSGSQPANGQQSKSKEWAAAAKRSKGLATKAREAKPGGFENPEIADGTYTARILKAQALLFPAKPPRPGKKEDRGIPETAVFNIDLVVTSDGDYYGTKIRRTDRLPILDQPAAGDEQGEKDYDSAQRAFDNLVKNLHGCFPKDEPMDFSDFVVSDLPDMAAELTPKEGKEGIELRIGVKNNSGSNGRTYVNVYLNGVAADASGE